MFSYISILTTDTYLPGVIVIKNCLKLTQSTIPFHVCVTENLSDKTIKTLNHNNIKTIPIKKITNEKIKTKKHWANTWSKLNIFNLTQFEKIVYIDADMIICENIDDLFNKPHFSAVNAGGFIFPDWVDLNSGLLVIEPKKEIFDDLIKILEEESSEQIKGDQDILHIYFPNWSEKKELNLGYQYNVFQQHMKHKRYKKLKYNVIKSINDISNEKKENYVKIIHYIKPKPWTVGKNFRDNNVYYQIWNEIYQMNCKINES